MMNSLRANKQANNHDAFLRYWKLKKERVVKAAHEKAAAFTMPKKRAVLTKLGAFGSLNQAGLSNAMNF